MSGRTLIRNPTAIATLEKGRPWFPGGYILVTGNRIESLGRGAPPEGRYDRVVDATDMVALPGLINTHHHFIQTLNRCYPPALNSGLFEWLQALYPVWARLDEEGVRLGTAVALAELLLSGCTTTCDHHCFVPRGQGGHFDIQVEVAREMGIRFHVSRGSMSLGRSKGGLPLDENCEEEDEILSDSERLIDRYHDPRPSAMVQVALSPCSPFSVSRSLMRESAALAQRHRVRLHTHLAETLDEEAYCQSTFGMRPLDCLEDCGWLSRNVWLAHGIHFNDGEVERLGRAGVAIAHCPTSNMRLGSGIAKVRQLLQAGSPVGLGVDGSASNDSSHMLAEARQALLLHRVVGGAKAMTVEEAFRLATAGGAACLGREDIGALRPGAMADIALFSLEDLGYSGAGDPLAALLLCAPTRVHTLMVHGRLIVEAGQLLTFDIASILPAHRKKARHLQQVGGS